MTDDDFSYIRANIKGLEVADLTMAETKAVPKYGLQSMTKLRKCWLGPAFETIDVQAFCYDAALEEIDLANAKSIGKWAFYGCTSLRAIDIPESVTTLGPQVFQKCSNLTTVTLHEGLTTLSEYSFYSCGVTELQIPSTVTKIPAQCFMSCPKLRQVTILGGSSIGESAFSSCYLLEQVSMPDGVSSIGDNAFFACHSLESFIAPASLTVIGKRVFQYCKSLSVALLHDNITTIDERAFADCLSLKEITMADRQPRWPTGLQTLGNGAFENCSGLETAYLNSTKITKIPTNAFINCRNLNTVKLPAGLTEVGNYSFMRTGIEEIETPATVTSLGINAFRDCHSLTLFTCRAETAPTFNATFHPFDSSFKTNCTLKCPKDSDYSAYESYFNKRINL